MSTNHIGFNYASAFIEALATDDEIRAGADDLAAFEALVDELPALARVLDHPGQPLERRKTLLDDVLTRLGAQDKTRRLMHLVVQNGRMREFRAIRGAFNKLRDTRRNVESAEVVTVNPLGASEREDWEQALARLTGKMVRVTYRTDATLVGGALTRIGSVVYDGSLRKQLQRIRGVLLGSDA